MTGDPFAAAATYLGTTTADLQTKIRAGQTLAQIANATAGKSRDGLVGALVSDATAKIDAAQKAGTITADQATQLKSNLNTPGASRPLTRPDSHPLRRRRIAHDPAPFPHGA